MGWTHATSRRAALLAACALSLVGCAGEVGTGGEGGGEDMLSADMSPDQPGEVDMSTRARAITFDPAPRDWVAPLGVGVLDAALVDGDGDGVLDVVVLTSRGVELLRGDGRAGFTLPVPMNGDEPAEEMEPGEGGEDPPTEDPPAPTVARLLGADLDADGQPELVSCDSEGGVLAVHARVPLAQDTSARAPVRAMGCSMLGAGDLDGDGADDVIELLDLGEGRLGVSAWRYERVSATSREVSALIASSSGPLQDLGVIAPSSLLARDFDDDGASEVLITEGARVLVYKLVDGALERRGELELVDVDPARVRTLSAIDVDGDGHLDLHVGVSGAQDRLYLSDGAGRFAEATFTRLPVEDAKSMTSVVIDLNEDGRAELVMGTDSGFDRLYQGSEDGRLVDITPKLGFVDTDTRAMLAGDLDGDGDTDLVSVGAGGQLSVFSRRGSDAEAMASAGGSR